MYALSASSQGLLVCMIFSIIFVVVYCLYLIVVRRLYAGIKTITPPHLLKYVLIAHLLCATWYYWAAVITYVLHYSNFQVFDVIFDDDGIDQFSIGDRNLSITIFVITIVSIVVDLVGVHNHTAKAGFSTGLAMSPNLSPVRQRSGIWRAKPRVSSVISVIVDALMLMGTIQSMVMQGDLSTIALIVLLLISVVFQARYTWLSWQTSFLADSDWHMDMQLLLLQHMLIVSTVFLVNMLLLLSHAIGHSFNSMLANADSTVAALLCFSLGSYVLIALTTILLVYMHTQVEMGNLDAGGFLPSRVGGYAPLTHKSQAVPVPLDLRAITVPLDG